MQVVEIFFIMARLSVDFYRKQYYNENDKDRLACRNSKFFYQPDQDTEGEVVNDYYSEETH